MLGFVPARVHEGRKRDWATRGAEGGETRTQSENESEPMADIGSACGCRLAAADWPSEQTRESQAKAKGMPQDSILSAPTDTQPVV